MTNSRRFTAVIAAAAALALTITSCSSSSTDTPTPESTDTTGSTENAALTTLSVATIGLTSDGALLTGIENGFFQDEGLEIETSIVANPPAGLAAAQSGQVDIAYSPSIPLLNALSQGVGLNVIGAADGYPAGALDAADPADMDDTGFFASKASGITSVAELAGKTIAVPARKAQLEVVIAGELEKAGIDHETGVNWVVLDFTSAVSALNQGTVDAAGLVSPFTSQALEAGNPLIASPSLAFFEEGAVGLWVTGSQTIDKKADAIAAFQRAITKSNQYANEHQDEAIQAGLDYTKSTLTVDQVIKPYWPASVQQSDLDRPDTKLTDLKFLDKPVDLTGVIWTK